MSAQRVATFSLVYSKSCSVCSMLCHFDVCVFACDQKNVGARKFWVSPDLSYVLLAYDIRQVVAQLIHLLSCLNF